MSNPSLPRPVTVGDKYLAAILEELQGLRQDVRAQTPSPAVADTVELREPAKPKRSSKKAK